MNRESKSRIGARFAKLAAEGRGALIPFLEAYDPDPATSLEMLRGLPAAGADLIEIGVPFTDPVADGPTIQRAAQRALAAGASLPNTLAMVAAFRTDDAETPIILMGYLNPIEHYGVERFCQDAARAGVDGLIIVDLPPEESDLILPHAVRNEMDVIRLVAPTTSDDRLSIVTKDASGFIYYVSITGITGTSSASEQHLANAIPRIRAATDLPVVIGFGVRTPEQAKIASRISNGAVVASALIDTISRSLDENGAGTKETVEAVLQQVRALADAVGQP